MSSLADFQPKVAIVILNYNTRSLLERFLPGVLETNYSNKEVWVVDNASTDDSVEFTKSHFNEVRLLVSEKNLGFAGGYNWALDQIEADYYVLLNSDVRVTPNWLKPLVDLAISDKTIAAIQPKILDAKEPRMFEYAGASGGFLDKWGYPFCRGRVFDSLEEDAGQYNDAIDVFWASGACMFIQADLYHKARGLDADFFAHMEEIDLCWRLQRMGYSIKVQPASEVFHIGGGTLAEGSDRKYFLNFRNNLFLLAKNSSSPFWLFLIIWRMVLDGISAIVFLLDGKASLVITILKAHFAFWMSLGSVLKKRKLIKELGNSKVYLHPDSIVWQYFIKKKKKFTDL
ncbi:MAG: dTDP-Rha--alpha-D-GlcNAc-pyrophosphate polyprenol alpha-3-L-rhamnosyltransferase [Bacteroidetes bacterium]|nr:MAG: dTDP-Rha--alpha-D-GlcNAc-pyrophosphate polyprenol alpha-3-L-rhamnosyltransferase [Bacteroidota bacterium]